MDVAQQQAHEVPDLLLHLEAEYNKARPDTAGYQANPFVMWAREYLAKNRRRKPARAGRRVEHR